MVQTVPIATVAEITIFPVKSLKGIKLDKALITKYGTAHPEYPQVIDRKWMIVDINTGSFKTQRQMPKMALMEVSVSPDGLVITVPGKNALKVPFQPTHQKMNCRVWNARVDAYLYSPEVGKWISEFLETEDLNLAGFREELCEPVHVKVQNDVKNGDGSRDTDVVIFQDYSPYMLISRSSLDHLNEKLASIGKKVTMRHFRPTIVADGCSAFAEDSWASFKIGETVFQNIKPCTRCLLTTVNPEMGVKDPEMQPLKTLKEFRIDANVDKNSPLFGINLAADNFGAYIRVGDEITSVQ